MNVSLRVAIIGSGPSALYAAAELLKRDASAQVDLFERLPTPGGLVRAGVSPDHSARRDVSGVYERLLSASGRFRFFGNVEIGRDLALDELAAAYHAILHASGAASDRRLGIPGEDLLGSHAATRFVGWYNGHPDDVHQTFDLSCERAVVVGNGNVALDVARMLLLPVEHLRRTDIADHALAALAQSRVREVVVLGRRGPAQAAFTAPELIELGDLPGVDVSVEASASELVETAAHPNPLRLRVLRELSERSIQGHAKRLVLHFLSSPLEIIGDTQVRALRVGANQLVHEAGLAARAQATGKESRLDTGLVFRAVGYRAQPLPGLPFDAQAGCVPNEGGRVIDPRTGEPCRGHYVAGWLKRGPSGVIGSNKPCSQQTVRSLLDDAAAGRLLSPVSGLLDPLLATRQTDIVDYHAWKRIDRHERLAGCDQQRPRVKLCSTAELLHAAR